MSESIPPSFGLDDFALDDRMRLFGYVTAENRLAYLWVLRAFDAARSAYRVVLHTSGVASTLEELSAAHPDCPSVVGQVWSACRRRHRGIRRWRSPCGRRT